MRLSSLRVRFLALTILFALLLVGTVSVVSYVVVTDAMMDVAESSMLSIAESANQRLRDEVSDAKLSAAALGMTGDELDEAAYLAVVASLPELFQARTSAEGEYALYDGELSLQWYSSPSALNEHETHRIVAQRNERPVDSGRVAITGLAGLFASADMGEYVAHIPIELPGRGVGVLDVTYLPVREEATVDRIRPWMLLLSVTAVIIAVVLMQASTGWVLALIGDLRSAADSVDANELDVHLPDLGRHEIGDLARALNSLMDRLRQRADAQTRFVADASHELATPVAGIRGYVSILRAWGGEDPELRSEAIEAIDRESSRMARLCSDLLSLIRRERFTEMQVQRVDVNAAAREALAAAATRYLAKGIEFVGPEEGHLVIYTDPDRLAQLLSILVDNAAKYTPEEGRVSVRTWRRLETVTVEVSDTGIGIPAQDLPHVFERFYRSDESRSSETGGFGIGLSIAKTLSELMGGSIKVDSEEDIGTTFTVRIPRRHPYDADGDDA